MCQANFDTATWVTSAVVAMPPSTRRGGLLAWTIAPSQVRQAYFGKIVLFTRTQAGTTSRASRVSAPIRWSAPEQQGQTVVSGSITSSHRGRCLGSAPMLRTAGRRGRSPVRVATPSSLAGGGGGVGPTARSSRSSGSWATSMTAAFSDRAPKRRSFKVRTIARKLSFSASSASTIAARRAGSEGTSTGRIGIPEDYRIGARFTIQINQITQPEGAFAPVAERPSSNQDHQPNFSTNTPTAEDDVPALASVTVEDPPHPLF